jgi:hypothetical protein
MECTLVKSALGGEEVGKDEGKVSSSDEKLRPLRGAVGETMLSQLADLSISLFSSRRHEPGEMETYLIPGDGEQVLW